MAVSMGYKETGLAFMGLFVIDEVTSTGWPQKLNISGKSADMRGPLKQPKTRQFKKGMTIGDIVSQIAGEHGLPPIISPDLQAKMPGWLGQTEESDLNFLTKLAGRYDAVSKPANGKWLFVKRGEAKSASGQPILPIIISPGFSKPGEILSYSCPLGERMAYGKVTAMYHDRAANQTKKVEAAEGDGPEHVMRYPFPNQDRAKEAANAKKKELKRAERSFDCEVVGDPAIMAETPIEVEMIRAGVDGPYKVKTARHKIDGSGYRCSIEAENPA